MLSRTGLIAEDVHAYLQSVSLREPAVLARLRQATAPRPEAGMQISPEQGQFMQLLVRILGARSCLDSARALRRRALAMMLRFVAMGCAICEVSTNRSNS